MAKLLWDQTGERVYETGVDHGVLYLRDNTGAYPTAVAWNGLVSVTEAPSGAEASPFYADNIKYINLRSAEEFGATIEAYTYPDEFMTCDGSAIPTPGLVLGQQGRDTFGLSYRTKIGDDVAGQDAGYKIHLVYGASAAPSEKAYTTVNDSPEPITFSWELTTDPISVEGYKPLATITIDSTKTDPAKLAELENLLYGTDGTPGTSGKLPLPDEVLALLVTTVEVTPTAPTEDANVITIPSQTGVVYQVDGSPVSGTVTMTDDTTVVAVPASGYSFPSGATTSWSFTFVP